MAHRAGSGEEPIPFGGAVGSAGDSSDFLRHRQRNRRGVRPGFGNGPTDSLGSAAVRRYAAGGIIYHQGADCRGIYRIESGLIGQRAYDDEGNSVLIRLRGPGTFIGYRAYFAGTEHLVSAEVLMPARVRFIDRRSLEGWLANGAEIRRFLETAMSDLTETEERLVRTVTKNAAHRVLRILAGLYVHFGEVSRAGEPVLELPISRQDLAGLVGIVPESLSRTIRRLESAGIARFDGRCVRFTDTDCLRREAEGIG